MRVFSKLAYLFLALCLLVIAQSAYGAPTLETLKMARRFGLGISAGGPLSILGVEADVNIQENFSLALGVGTGLNYSSVMLKGRYFLLGEWVSPYVACAVARWWTQGTTATQMNPSILSSRFLPAGYDYTQGFSLFFVAPAVGVQFMHPMGFAVSLELQQLFKMVDLSNGTYASVSAHWYF